MRAIEVFKGSDGDATKDYYQELYQKGFLGTIAVNLFRAQKCSDRAKVYRGGLRSKGSFKNMAYERKAWSIQQLSDALVRYGQVFHIPFGWKTDPDVPLRGGDSWVIYVDLPMGQVSFHSTTRYAGPDYKGEWDGQRMSALRILQFCDAVMDGYALDVLDNSEERASGREVPAEVSIHAVQPADRPETQNGKVLLSGMPAQGSPRDA